MKKYVPEIIMVLALVLVSVAGSITTPYAGDKSSSCKSGIYRSVMWRTMLGSAKEIATAAEECRESNGRFPSFSSLDSLMIDQIAVGLYETTSTQDSTGQDWSISYWICPETSQWFQLTLWGCDGEKIGVINNFAEKRE